MEGVVLLSRFFEKSRPSDWMVSSAEVADAVIWD